MAVSTINTHFSWRAAHVRDLQDSTKDQPVYIRIVKIIELSQKQYQYFSTHLWLDMPFIATNKDLMCEAGGLYHCLLVCAQNRRDGSLVESEGYTYSRYTAYAADRSALNLRDVPVERHNLKLRQPRSGPER